MERNTRQRTAILDAFREADRPLAPGELLALAGKRLPGLGQATVYRAIKSLLDERALVAVAVPGEPDRYEIAGKPHHHHFYCRACQRVYEMEGCPGPLNALAPKGFEVEAHEVLLYGRCAACSSTPARRAVRQALARS